MKKNILLLLLFSQYSFSINWITSFDEAREESLSQNKFMVVVFTANWCKPCKEMELGVWIDKDVENVLENFIPVKIDVDEYKNIASKYDVEGIPQILIIDANGKILTRFYGTNLKSYMLEMLNKYLLNTCFMSKETAVYFENKSFSSSLRLYLKYLDFSLYADISIKDKIINLGKEYFKEAEKRIKKKDLAFVINKQKLELLNLYQYAYSNNFIKLKEKLTILNSETILDDNKQIYYFLKYLLLKSNNDNLDEIRLKTTHLDGFESFIDKADFILSKK